MKIDQKVKILYRAYSDLLKPHVGLQSDMEMDFIYKQANNIRAVGFQVKMSIEKILCKSRDVNRDLTPKDQDKDLTPKDKDLTPKDKDLTHKDQDKDHG